MVTAATEQRPGMYNFMSKTSKLITISKKSSAFWILKSSSEYKKLSTFLFTLLFSSRNVLLPHEQGQLLNPLFFWCPLELEQSWNKNVIKTVDIESLLF